MATRGAGGGAGGDRALFAIWVTVAMVFNRKTLEGAREQAVREREAAWAQVKILRGLLPICAWCKKVRDDEGLWRQIETYIREHSEAAFSHGICPECNQRLRAEMGAAKRPEACAG